MPVQNDPTEQALLRQAMASKAQQPPPLPTPEDLQAATPPWYRRMSVGIGPFHMAPMGYTPEQRVQALQNKARIQASEDYNAAMARVPAEIAARPGPEYTTGQHEAMVRGQEAGSYQLPIPPMFQEFARPGQTMATEHELQSFEREYGVAHPLAKYGIGDQEVATLTPQERANLANFGISNPGFTPSFPRGAAGMSQMMDYNKTMAGLVGPGGVQGTQQRVAVQSNLPALEKMRTANSSIEGTGKKLRADVNNLRAMLKHYPDVGNRILNGKWRDIQNMMGS
jgi:hypothetical protein